MRVFLIIIVVALVTFVGLILGSQEEGDEGDDSARVVERIAAYL